MSRSALVLLVCTGLVFIGSGIQSSRATRLRARANAIHPNTGSFSSVDAEAAAIQETISRWQLQSAAPLARPQALSELADELVREVTRAAANLTRLSMEPEGPTLALSATGDRIAVARLVSRFDTLLESHGAYAERFSLAGGHDTSARLDLSITHAADPADPSISVRSWPTVGPEVVADALEPTRASVAPAGNDAIAHDDDATAPPPIDPTTTNRVSWLGTIRAGGVERYVLRLEDERVVAVLGEGETAVLGWTVRSRESNRLHLSRKGIVHEVRR